MKKIIPAVLLCLIIMMPIVAFAQTGTNACNSGDTSLPKCVNQVYIWSLGISAILALMMIVFGGYVTLTAAGNAERASRGKNYITSSIVGLVLLFGAYILLRTINPDLVDFSNSCANANSSCFTPQPPPPTHPPGT